MKSPETANVIENIITQQKDDDGNATDERRECGENRRLKGAGVRRQDLAYRPSYPSKTSASKILAVSATDEGKRIQTRSSLHKDETTPSEQSATSKPLDKRMDSVALRSITRTGSVENVPEINTKDAISSNDGIQHASTRGRSTRNFQGIPANRNVSEGKMQPHTTKAQSHTSEAGSPVEIFASNALQHTEDEPEFAKFGSQTMGAAVHTSSSTDPANIIMKEIDNQKDTNDKDTVGLGIPDLNPHELINSALEVITHASVDSDFLRGLSSHLLETFSSPASQTPNTKWSNGAFWNENIDLLYVETQVIRMHSLLVFIGASDWFETQIRHYKGNPQFFTSHGKPYDRKGAIGLIFKNQVPGDKKKRQSVLKIFQKGSRLRGVISQLTWGILFLPKIWLVS